MIERNGLLNLLGICKVEDQWTAFRRRATEGIATWLSRLPGGIGSHLSCGAGCSIDGRVDAGRLLAFVHDRVTIDPATRKPLAPVQIFLLELALEAVDWQALAGEGESPAAGRPAGAELVGADPRERRPLAGGRSAYGAEACRGGMP